MSGKRSLLNVLLLAAGCGSVSAERGHTDVAALVAARGGPNTHWDKGTPDDAAVAKWVDDRLSGGLTRDEAVQIALVNNPTLQTTYESLGVFQADMVQAGLLSNPTLSASVGFNSAGRLTEGNISLAQNILDLLILPLRKDIAREQFMTDVMRVAHSALDVAADVKKAFVEVEASAALIAHQLMIVQGAQAAADLSRRQFEAGNINELSLATTEAEAEQSKLDLAHEQIEELQMREKLTQLMGLWGSRTTWTITTTLAQPEGADPATDQIESVAMMQRLDIDAARKEARLMAKAVDLASSARWFGRIEVGVEGHRDPDGPRVLGPTLVLELPFFDRRGVYVSRLQAERRAAERRLNALAINARSEVRLAAVRLTTQHRVVDHYRNRVVPLREKIVQETQLHYNGMLLGLYQLLTAKKAESEAKRGYLESLRDYWIARADLERAAGGTISTSAIQQQGRTPAQKVMP